MTDYIDYIPPIYKNNYTCTLNPNPDFSVDCLGTNNNKKTRSSSGGPSGPLCFNKTPQDPDSNRICVIDGVQCEIVNPKKLTSNIYPMICKKSNCKYFFNEYKDINTLNPVTQADVTFCTPAATTPSSIDSTPSTAPSIAPSAPIYGPSISAKFQLYQNMLPIVIPSVIDPIKDGVDYVKKIPDVSVKNFWISHPSIPKDGYSDIYPDTNPTLPTSVASALASIFGGGRSAEPSNESKWKGLKAAMSKCIELDGSFYPPSTTPNSTPSNSTPSNSTPSNSKYAYPNKKPNCYAIAVQSDFTGLDDNNQMKTHSYTYNLVQMPTKEYLEWANRNQPPIGFINSRPYDNNYLMCQKQFYTWVKKKPDGTPYNPTKTVTKTDKIYTSPSRSYNSPSYVAIVPSPTAGDLQCPRAAYIGISGNLTLPEASVPKGFWGPSKSGDFNWKGLLNVATPEKKDNTVSIIIGVIVGLVLLGGGGYYYYVNYVLEPATPTVPIQPVVSKGPSIAIKSTGGYFFYE